MNTNRWTKELGFIGDGPFNGYNPPVSLQTIQAACKRVGTRVVVVTTINDTDETSIANLQKAGFVRFATGKRQGDAPGPVTLWRKTQRPALLRTNTRNKYTFCCGLMRRIDEEAIDTFYQSPPSIMRIDTKPLTHDLPEGYKVLPLAKGYWLSGRPVK